MATLTERLSALFRYRVGKYNSQTIEAEMGINPIVRSGVNVTEQSALAISTVYACINKIASTISSLDLELYVRDGRNIEVANQHPSYDLITSAPNEHQNAFDFWENVMSSALMYGCGYAIIERNARGYAERLVPVSYYDVDVKEVEGERVFVIRDYGAVTQDNMLEISCMNKMSPIRLHRENMGLAKAAQDFGSEYFGQKGQMTGVLASDQPLRKEQMDVIQNSWNQSAMNAGTKLLPFGFKYQRITITPDEAQFIETRKFQAEEICRIYSVPTSLVQLPSQTTFNNVEQQNLQFARHTIAPWAKRIEQEIDRKLIQSFERPDVYSKFNMNDLYRGDLAARTNFYQQMLQSGVMSINEVRGKEQMNPVDGGDQHTIQINQIALDRLGEYSEKKYQPMEDNNQHKDAEKRTMGTIEVRESDSDEMTLEGYAAVFNSETDLGAFREVIRPGAFDDVMDNDVRALINHDPNLILGRTGNGTLELSTDERGLKYKVKLGNQQYARDFYESVKRGDISQSSFAFTIDEQSWNEERTVRSVDKVRQLLDVSPVTYPAYAAATVQARDQQLELDEAIADAVADTDTEKNEPQIPQQMNLNEMKATRAKHADRFEELVNVAETENRDWTNNEQEEADLCKREVERLDGKIARRQAHEDMIARQAQMGGTTVSEAKEINKINRSFSLSRAVNAVCNSKALEGAEAEWAQEANREMQTRGLNMSGQIGIPASALYRAIGDADTFGASNADYAGAGFVPTQVPGAIEALRTPTMAERIGVTTINNATANLQFPRVSTKAVGTAATEIATGANSTLDMDTVTLTPNRVANKTLWSKQLMLQGGPEVDALISRELAAGINETIDKAVFAAAAGAGKQIDKANGAVGYADITEAQKAVLAAGGDLSRCAFVGSPSAMSILKGEAAVASIKAVVDGNNIDGYQTYFTPNLVDSTTDEGALLFGDYAAGMLLAFFGGVDLLVDPFSNAGTAQIALHVNKFYDTAVRQAGALAYAYDFIAPTE